MVTDLLAVDIIAVGCCDFVSAALFFIVAITTPLYGHRLILLLLVMMDIEWSLQKTGNINNILRQKNVV